MEKKFFEALRVNDTAKVKQLVRENPQYVNYLDKDGYTPLMVVAGLGYKELTSVLLAAGADVNATDRTSGASPLHMAALGGNTEVAIVLLKGGAQLNIQAASHGMTPLMNAVWYRNPSMVQLLLKQERINTSLKNGLGLTAEEIIKVMSSSYRKSGKLEPDGELMQRFFDEFNKSRTVNDLSRQLLDVVANYDKKYNPQQMLAEADKLIKQGANVNTREYVNGRGYDYHTPILMASLNGYTELVKLLLKSGADITMTCEYMKANVAHKAAYNGHAEVLRLLVAHPQFDKIKNAQGPYNGYTPLHDAIWHGHTEAAAVLIQAGVDKTPLGLDGLTALEMARKYGYEEIVKLLSK